MLEKGCIQVYTGNGKGKTTAALGISLRAVCAGNKVFFGQFMKGQEYSEKKAPQLLPGFTLEQFGDSSFIKGAPTEKNVSDAVHGLERIRMILASGEYDLVVMDEINTALFFNLISVSEVLTVLDLKPEKTEVILTGRYAPQEILDRAELVTEMKEVKHYYNSGVNARTGIEN
ncbi:MAG: cob(I)yrinic acid a,c-diamide adenosyltransferase [Eubacteriales bacterium]|nr:cob(I)yrinic acid a,c-diamide adenosyltransferase [Eubacteriales bacterium]MDD3198714.1 cob(I)yrinic acid a,c-diamide adenosyltransferase [Eubacteriales bacterium]MDD4121888.1 cob(I)yrinic acid a,c-diamide adenosyltransferase [Eubacteriales bacterium]MDD4629040.1 cob(I)yrinic acid a,c-diamide adenosyltransferase [Eubacteriales bacterium]